MSEAVAGNATSRWGAPDPRNAAAYPKATAATSMRQWAWEFLRRSPDYRGQWERKLKPFLDAHGNFNQAVIECGIRAMEEHRDWTHPRTALEEAFRIQASPLNLTLSPYDAEPPFFAGESVATVLFRDYEPDSPVDVSKVLLEFDLKLPLEAQLKNARRLLMQRQARQEPQMQRRSRLQIEKFPRYLRLLDFEDAATPDKEIGRHLFPHLSDAPLRDAIRKNLAAARRLQGAYFSIALQSPTGSGGKPRKTS